MDPARAGYSFIFLYNTIFFRVWAESTCIYKDMDLGSMIPYINRARSKGYSIIILNPNKNVDPVKGEVIVHNSSMKEHCRYVWKNVLIPKCPAKKWYVIAFSAGGYCVHDLLLRYGIFMIQGETRIGKEFMERVVAVVLTDTWFEPIEAPLKPYIDKV
eukprot:TRINITY_DN12827_c0_g1_i1.p4 TRINITY_DN12827_c0_g1~~TRINITY_DN12827_c0_g1_i1.p4  ORF type:complete len:158 (-),score=4.47 TRINITY_DN12827_c0_g1_i1:270-743(-)